MKKYLLSLAASFLLSVAAFAQSLPPPNIAARSFLLMDATSGQIIAAQEPHMRVEPASRADLVR